MIDRKWIGYETPAAVLPIERTRLLFFAEAIGETDLVYTDLEAARAAGYPDLPAPPTFLFAAELDGGQTKQLLTDLGIPLARLLHGEQGFSYYRAVCAGDTVTVRGRITDIYDKKNGALEFIVRSANAFNQHGEAVAEVRSVIVVRNQ
jgi:acyl dehydratase